jgi:pSer/pThr/pTyr-binding forkhead associated (FHA) protein
LGDSAAQAAVNACLSLVAGVVRKARGDVVKRIGDEIMAAFSSPGAMFDAAVAMQRTLHSPERELPEDGTQICIRVGFHFGPALAQDADFFGDTVNVAARMVGLAKGRQIITTMECARMIEPLQQGMTRTLDRVSVKGKAEEIEVVEVLWEAEDDEARTLWTSRGINRPSPGSRNLILSYQQRQCIFGASKEAVSVGRDPHNDVVIEDHRVSRRHATIERRNPNWVIVDHSTNGTCVLFARGDHLLLRHAELILHGTGRFAFGHSAPDADNDPHLVQFALSSTIGMAGDMTG